MRVITLENVRRYVEDTVGRPQVLIPNIALFNPSTEELGRFAVIIDSNISEDILCNSSSECINCLLPESYVDDFGRTTPYIKSREALSGHIVVDGRIPTEDELMPYLFLI